MRRFVFASFALFATTLVHDDASANAPEDMFGTGARIIAMGGAGTASSRDGFAAYYNPEGSPHSRADIDEHLNYRGISRFASG